MIKTTYREVEITYDEDSETWNCQVNTKRRSRTNLKDCKDAIDKFLDGEEKLKKKFERFDVWNAFWVKITVTSITDDAVWVTNESGYRQKKSMYDCRSLFLDTPENNTIIEQIKLKEEEAKIIEEKIEELRGKLAFLKPEEILKQIA